ncbi:Sec23/Sec24 trunk domain containing protein [Trichomonas vaginalis G3]|uniref:Sec23/Sec24 trunk domain containing protein n=1 Tax=Trichomonas vaginalis (strain ATCC PRA-98 / G3) TaxID=412133 RepID=A2DNZ8_TRIV3|nr:ER to Golgi vesicle-mediated transport [Trichomonas vaginalis G3]EAY17847.1 Sec23/Sec24 trunk domain containing protein [Trichomonas vaginalis G3]KAI5489953.1 ER to Golgi vesicle-mediated transport [Trichomonas vaginalis G3]|eukprot:XP_001329982.1 Sec23/Sec24 trunk domain containing protein [Trichomonas vaginalis G3]
MNQTIRICLITFSDFITIYDPKKRREINILDLNDIDMWSLDLLPLSESLDYYLNILTRLSNLEKSETNENCLGSLYSIACKLIPYGGILIVCTSNYTTTGQGIIEPDEEHINLYKNIKRTKEFYNSISNEFVERDISLHLFLSSSGDDFSSLTALPCTITSGFFNVYKMFNESKDFPILFSDLCNSLRNKYFWHSRIEICHHPALKITKLSLNGKIIKENEAFCCNLSTKDSILVNFDFKEGYFVSIGSGISSFQVQITYFDESGNKRIKVITHTFPITSKKSIVRQRYDVISGFTYYVRSFVDSNSIMFLRDIINLRDQRMKQIARFFLDTPVIRSEHPNGEDGRFSDFIYIKTFDPFQLFLYIRKRIEYFGFSCNDNNNNPFCMAVQTVNSIALIVSRYSDEEWLYSTFGVRNLSELPLFLPNLDSEENRQLWNFSHKYSIDIDPIIYIYE